MSLKKFIGYSILNNISTSCSSVISTNSMLSVISVPNSRDIISLNYIGKDIIGQLGSLVYFWRKKKKPTKIENRFKAAFYLQQTSFMIENSLPVVLPLLNSPLLGSMNSPLPILGSVNILKNISFISVGAINIEKMEKLKQDENIGDLYSKIAIINTLSSTFGMILGLMIVYFIPSFYFRTLVCLPLFGILSGYSLQKISQI